ncbi:protein BPS1, chloroplastic-like isoform X1 [Cucurbita moschata]|uniref:Protein BPS1, chloroplastic-like isoform X1 n=1 Tax=Cucurbita moschata TaxID=3662 RepID=A0A6J1E9P0_CUCMO|nr:protein BPS1, chloroplastic-like isoform X1 [Cucurbita moschata]XP_022924522.1 protein BPS1, chloroplastic-like isoform X1 [Cucurbita moschata]XP_022924523.1 protein BPS1, chloroplastic-like isoform X1 [Cucurbita moschata]
MSKPQEPHRPFFHFGNPFRAISPKGSKLSSRLVFLLATFEDSLAQKLRKLTPKSDHDVFSFLWMGLAMKLLCEIHNDVKTLIGDLELPVSDWGEKWLDEYLDISVKLLDICNDFSSDLSQLNQGHLILRCALHNLASTSSNQFVPARSSLDAWNQHISSRTSRVENRSPIMDHFEELLDLPKVKNSPKGKVLMQVMYGVKVATLFICSVFAYAFSGSSKRLLSINVPDTYRWAQAFIELQKNVNMGIKINHSSGRFTALRDLNAVDERVKKLHSMIQENIDGGMKVEECQNLIVDLRSEAEKLTQVTEGKDQKHEFSCSVSRSRTANLAGEHLRVSCTNWQWVCEFYLMVGSFSHLEHFPYLISSFS